MKNERTVPIGQLDQSSPEFSNWRQDLAQAGLGSLAIAAIGVLLLLGLIMAGWWSWTFLMWAVYVLIVGAMSPIAALGYMSYRAVVQRHRLARERVAAETYRLRSELDLNNDGDTDKTEVLRFLKYVRHIYYGGSTSSTEAERAFKMSFAIWARYRDALVAMGLAMTVGKGPGMGFELHPRVKDAAWGDVERRIRDALLGRISLDITEKSASSVPQNQRKLTASNSTESGEGVKERITTLD